MRVHEPRTAQRTSLSEEREPDAARRVAIHAIVHTRNPIEHHLGTARSWATEVESCQTEQRRLVDGQVATRDVRLVPSCVEEAIFATVGVVWSFWRSALQAGSASLPPRNPAYLNVFWLGWVPKMVRCLSIRG